MKSLFASFCYISMSIVLRFQTQKSTVSETSVTIVCPVQLKYPLLDQGLSLAFLVIVM